MTSLTFALLVLCVVSYSHCQCPEKSQIFSSGLLHEEAQEILDLINELRNGTVFGIYGQPAASDLKPIVYDKNLQTAAQNFVNLCNIEDVEDVQMSAALQLTSRTLSESPEFPKIINVWFNEKKYFVYPNGVYGSTVADYLRIVHYQTEAVGCGFIHYVYENTQDAKLYACKFNLPADFYGYAPYSLDNNIFAEKKKIRMREDETKLLEITSTQDPLSNDGEITLSE